MFKHLLLPLDLQFFATDEGGSGGGQASEGQEGVNGQPSNQDQHNDKNQNKQQKEIMIPKSRFDEVNNAYKQAKARLDELEKAQKQKEEEEAKNRGEFEKLYNKVQSDYEKVSNDYKAAKERVETLEAVINELLEAKLKEIDEEYHDLIPENMTPEQKLAWVNNAQAKGLFGKKLDKEPLGEQTNPKGVQEVDTRNMNPLQMLISGYGKRK